MLEVRGDPAFVSAGSDDLKASFQDYVDVNRAPPRALLGRVRQKVVEHLADAIRVSHDHRGPVSPILTRDSNHWRSLSTAETRTIGKPQM